MNAVMYILCVLPKWVIFQIRWFESIDSFHNSGRIPPNMLLALALPRSRRSKPAFPTEGWVSSFG